ncbi:MAG TPA: SDR family oxidoreductase [Bryobacteraceae bacterium]
MGILSGKTALVTGSSRGIGKAIAERFAKLGADVIVNYSASKQPALATVEAIERNGVKAIAIQANLAKVDEIHRLFVCSMEHFGRLDIVVANAGIELVDQAIVDFTEEEFDRLFNVNTKGAFFTLQAAAKHVADNGRIIYVGSSTTRFPTPGHAPYGGSKLAPQFLVEVLAKEIGGRGVTVNSILPTATEGAGVSAKEVRPQVLEFIKNNNPMQRMATVEDVANAAEYLASDLSASVSGQHLLLSGGAPA